jgi:hypothetical protein
MASGGPPVGETLNISAPSSATQPRIEYQPYNPEEQRDYVRLIVTVGLLAMLFIVIASACWESASWPNHWQQTKEMVQTILSPLIGLIGSVIGFYFGASTTGGTPTSPKTGP